MGIKFKRKETNKEIHDRIYNLCNSKPKQIPEMDAQVAINEICKHLLGEDWYVVDPLCSSQVNPIIVEEIEQKYRKRIKLNLKLVIGRQ